MPDKELEKGITKKNRVQNNDKKDKIYSAFVLLQSAPG
jgi:hypothetical protein